MTQSDSKIRGRSTGRVTLVVVASVALVAAVLIAFLWRGGDRRESTDAATLRRLGEPARAKGYDLLVITMDTTRADRIGCYGYGRAETPHVDELARRGVRFAQAIAPTPITLPSHASLFTGLYPPAHGVRNNGTFALGSNQTTLAELLGAAGYATGAAVGAFVLEARFGLDQGFESYDDTVVPRARGAAEHTFAERRAAAVTDSAIAWLGGHLEGEDRKPFFIWAHYFDPHGPYRPPEPYGERFSGSPYDGEIAYTDAEIGRLLRFIDERGDEDRTLVLLTADHGEALGDHGETTHSILVHDSTIRIPLIFSCPSLFDDAYVAGDRVVSLVDVMPTLLSLLGVAAEQAFDGEDVFALEDGADRAVYIESMMPLLNHGWSSLHGLRRLSDKFIEAPKPEYYDLRDDPAENENLFGSAAAAEDLRRRLRARLETWGPVESVIDAEAPLDPELADRLAAMGYGRSQRSGASAGSRPDPKRMLPLWNRIEKAGALAARGELDQAVEEIKWVLKGDPENGRAWYKATQIYSRMKRFPDAETCIRNAVRLSPRADGYVSLGTILLAQKKFGSADVALSKAEELDPHDGRVYMARGDGLAMRRRFAEALVQFETALERDPVNIGPRARQKIAMAKKRLAQ